MAAAAAVRHDRKRSRDQFMATSMCSFHTTPAAEQKAAQLLADASREFYAATLDYDVFAQRRRDTKALLWIRVIQYGRSLQLNHAPIYHHGTTRLFALSYINVVFGKTMDHGREFVIDSLVYTSIDLDLTFQISARPITNPHYTPLARPHGFPASLYVAVTNGRRWHHYTMCLSIMAPLILDFAKKAEGVVRDYSEVYADCGAYRISKTSIDLLALFDGLSGYDEDAARLQHTVVDEAGEAGEFVGDVAVF